MSDDPGGGAFALFFRSHPGEFTQLMCPHTEEFANFFFLNANALGLARKGGWALLELTDALGWKVHDRTQSSVLRSYTMHELRNQHVSIG